MEVRVRFYGVVFDEIDTRELVLTLKEGSTVENLLESLTSEYPSIEKMVFDDEGRFRDYLEIAVNQTDIVGLAGVNTVLKDSDLVLLMPPIGGG